jgi:antitoxin VapB
MTLHIRSDEAGHLARRLATVTGQTVTEAVTQAMRERLDRLEQMAREGDLAAVCSDIRPPSKATWSRVWGEHTD